MSKINYLDASTGHITQHDSELLNNDEDLPFRYSSHQYGYIVFVNSETMQSELEDSPISDDFMNLYLHAVELKCGIINLDYDGDQLGVLHLNEW